jgi:LPS export ABC transporter protein LptC
MNKHIHHIKKLAAIFIGCLFISCENDIREIRALGERRTGIEEAKNIETIFTQGGNLRAKLNAPLMLRYQLDTPKTEFPNSLKVVFYDINAKEESKLSAKYGRYLDNQNMVYLRDSVVVFNVKGDTLYTSELFWDQNKQSFYTEKPVAIRKPNQQINGIGMTSDQAFKFVTIFKVTNSLLDVPDSTMPK